MPTDYRHALGGVPLFSSIESGDISDLLACLGAHVAAFEKDAYIWMAGDPADRIGVVLSGAVQIARDDPSGNRTILASLEPGDLFGEAFACAGIAISPVSVIAAEACEILLMDYRRVITACPSSCAHHHRLIENMMRLLAQKNILLNQKIEVLSARNTRDKVLAYLSACARKEGSRSFSIPFTRQQMADYLCVDRSAMSRALGVMRDEGLIAFHMDRFELLG